MNFGKIINAKKENSSVVVSYENIDATIDILSDDIINFFVPLYTKEHYSKAIEGDKHLPVEFTFSITDCVSIVTSKFIINVYDEFRTEILDVNTKRPILIDYQGTRKTRRVMGKKTMEMLKAEGHDVSGYGKKDHPICILKKITKDAVFYGLGDKTGFLNKRGYEYENWNSDIPQAHNEDYKALYKSIPFYITKTNDDVYGLFYDNTFKSYMNMGKESDEYVSYEADGGNIDYYFISGSNMKEVISGYTYLTGTVNLPKLWTLGYMQCRWGYECEQDIRNVANGFRDNKIPCDSVQYDIDYMEGYRVFTWDEKNYGKKGELFRDLKDNYGFKPVVIVDPGVKVDPEYFMSVEGHENNYFAKDPVTKEDYVNAVWPGDSNYPEFGKKEVRDWWGEHIKDFCELGVEGFWNDMNEPASFHGELPGNVIFHDESREIDHNEMHNIYGHYMSKATYDGIKKATNTRPFVITRACYAGTQKYSTVWTGDNQSLWSHIQMMIPQLCNLGISGFAIAGVDIGGFGADTTPELLVRWIEAAFMSTFFRNHSANGSLFQEPWQFGNEVVDIYRKYVELHYRFIPYIYDLLKETEETGIAPMRPLVLEYEDDATTYNLNTEYMVGPNMLVAPVIEQGANIKAVYLPEGDWYDFWTGEKHYGRQWIIKEAPIDICPIYIKSGSIIPMYELCQYVGEKAYNKLYLLKTGGEASYIHYQDNGVDFSYKNGEYNRYKFTVNNDGVLETRMLHEGFEKYSDIKVITIDDAKKL